MSRLTIPVGSRILFSTGDIKLWADLALLLRDGSGNWRPETFRVDTATDVSTLPAYHAKQLGLPMPQTAVGGATHTQTALQIRSGYLRFRVVGMDATEYATSCLFLGDPDTPPAPNQPSFGPRKLLQPFGLLDWLRFRMDKDPSDGTLYGTLTVEKQ
jgi:hypothetical protein